jgi:hypothetical protein
MLLVIVPALQSYFLGREIAAQPQTPEQEAERP